MYDRLSWGDGEIDLVAGVDGGLSGMRLRPNRVHGFKVIIECPLLK